MSYLVGNPEDRFSRDEAHLSFNFQIPTFALFRKWKAFSVWRRNVKTKKIHNCKKALNENLFIVNPVSLIYFNRNTVRSPYSRERFFASFHKFDLSDTVSSLLFARTLFLLIFANLINSEFYFTTKYLNVWCVHKKT